MNGSNNSRRKLHFEQVSLKKIATIAHSEEIPQSLPGFRRVMLDSEIMLIKSECECCGLSITRTIYQGLIEAERVHRLTCKSHAAK